ncbi:hypothetical protein BCON_0002g01110 [Botryotinia convoluta]|uniref:Uncharacterized protein n=1 Tax=Botryotinia convoluta TaxID=54673 RepID=A0A4Z1IVX7_9HELO|nr:hypothetical protein BCON_0002g01110 [Botryotinia convoluta]
MIRIRLNSYQILALGIRYAVKRGFEAWLQIHKIIGDAQKLGETDPIAGIPTILELVNSTALNRCFESRC